MRTLWCSLLLAAVAGGAAAQEREVTFTEPKPVTVSGFAVGLASYDRELKQNTAAGSKIAVSLFRPWSDGLYFFGQLTTSVTPGDSGATATQTEIDNLIVSWTPSGVTALNLTFGRFDAPLGFERDDEPLNLVPTNSFNFELARPGKLTGLVVRYALSPSVSAVLIGANGWEQAIDNNSGKTGGLRLEVTPRAGAAFGLTALYGPEELGTNANPRSLVAGDVTLQPEGRLIIGAEVNRGRQRVAGVVATWTGGAVTVFRRLGPAVGLTLRGELLDDPQGFRTGTPQTLSSVTVSPWYFYREAQEGIFSAIEHTSFRLPAFSLRPALRFDRSNVAFFPTKAGGPSRSHLSAVVELVYLF